MAKNLVSKTNNTGSMPVTPTVEVFVLLLVFLLFIYMARKEKKYHYIYKTTCLITNRYYYGMHSTNNLDDNYLGSGKYLWYSINKYGKENHIVEILEFLPNRKELKEREKEIINQQMLDEKLCMNLALGGQGGFINEEHRKVFLEAARLNTKKRWLNDEYRNKMISIASKRIKNTHKEGKIKYDTFKGKKHSNLSKLKMSESSKGMGIGENNSQYNTMWITNDVENRKIKKDDVIPDGWRKGRIMKKYKNSLHIKK